MIHVTKLKKQSKIHFSKFKKYFPYQEDMFIKIVASICFLSLSAVLIFLKNSPATHYEPSIYSSTSMSFWIILIISLFIGFTIIVGQVYKFNHFNTNMWLVGMLLIFLVYTIFLSLYIVRGYYLWNLNSDMPTHIGWIKETFNNGHVPSTLFYPLTHIYVVELLHIVGIDLIFLTKLIPLYFGILYVLFMHILAKSVYSDKTSIILATAASMTFVNGWYLNITPNHLSNLFFPCLLFVLINAFKKQKVQWKILLLIMVFFYPVFHPVPSLALIVILMTLWITEKALKESNYNFITKSSGLGRFNITIVTILFVWGILWISSFGIWTSTVKNIQFLIIENVPSHLSKLTSQIIYADGYGYNIYEYFLKVMGGTSVYLIITLLCIPILWNKAYKKINNNEFYDLLILYGPMFALCIFTFLLYFFNLSFGPLRIIIYITIINTIFVGFALCWLIRYYHNMNIKSLFACGFVVLLLTGITFTGMMNIYPSPYILKTSSQTTLTEMNGMEWFFYNRNIDSEISGISIAPQRFADFVLTSDLNSAQKLPYYLKPESLAPYHFGYNNSSTISSFYGQSKYYLLLTERDKSIYVDVFPEMAKMRWTSSDFEKMGSDSSINKLYSNSGFDIWYIDNSWMMTL